MKENNIPSWVWILIVVLILIIALLFFVLNQSVEVNKEAINNPTERLCVDACGSKLTLCNSKVRVYQENRDCGAEFTSCVNSCDY